MSRVYFFIGSLLLLMVACKKEKGIVPSNKDVNYLVVHDNPSDPVDHGIYQFYTATGIPVFYNDTLERKQVNNTSDIPVYAYIKLAVNYSPGGFDNNIWYRLLNSRQSVLPMLNIIQSGLISVLPNSVFVPSILLVDSLKYRLWGRDDLIFPLNAYCGFNTLVIRSINPDTLDAQDRKKYLAGILAAVSTKKLRISSSAKLDNGFYKISMELSPENNTYEQNFTFWFPDGSKVPEDLGFIFWYKIGEIVYTPSQKDDLTSYLEAAFYYTSTAFNTTYANYPAVLKKFQVVRTMLKELGFQFSD
ncbi:hypothetical protein [Niabella beijingensis]|uniref:hypothetical protein n=1 Tax=Niabella beijingensis TaxID=2872700 RepID=UPI001CBE66C1|nr:hypothetical protein [Niabella beijingensis]MBZ4189379.1 hypothetical protein [Niabella beijingensis]